ncbi:DUF952 domain-containing protein [Egbenema bharatensis]|uniref:DUF952 domain-containing protein n=1 Tax=Egbenema bharatensis TaxID=3463334 RepID=UPI003A89D982
MILHITDRQQWEQAKEKGIYRCESLGTEGFIHCSTPEQLTAVANSFFRGQQGLVLLCIEVDRLQAELRYDPVENQLFPHLYGPLNLDAVIQVLDFTPDAMGFHLPPELQ